MSKVKKFILLTLCTLLTVAWVAVPAHATGVVSPELGLGIVSALRLNGIGVFGDDTENFDVEQVIRDVDTVIQQMPVFDQFDFNTVSGVLQFTQGILQLPKSVFNWVVEKLAPYIRSSMDDNRVVVNGSVGSGSILPLVNGPTLAVGVADSTSFTNISALPTYFPCSSIPEGSSTNYITWSDGSVSLDLYRQGEYIYFRWSTSSTWTERRNRSSYDPWTISFWQIGSVQYMYFNQRTDVRTQQYNSYFGSIVPSVGDASGFVDLEDASVASPITSDSPYVYIDTGAESIEQIGDDAIANVPPRDYSDDLDKITSSSFGIWSNTRTIRDVLSDIRTDVQSLTEGGFWQHFVGDGFGIIDSLIPTLHDLGSSLASIWHYVVEWVASLGSGLSLFFGTIYSNIPFAIVLPVYASAVIVIIVSLFKRFIS